MIWILEYDYGEGDTWMHIFGSRKECLRESEYNCYQKRYKNYEAFSKARIDNKTNVFDYVIYKVISYEKSAFVWRRKLSIY